MPLHPLRRSRLVLVAILGLVAGVIPVSLPIGPRVEPALADISFTFDGGGYGHGVGMSQYGLLGMAKAGFSAPDMLAHYYSGTTVVPLDAPSRFSDLRVRLFGPTAPPISTTVTGSGQLQYFLNGAWCAQSPADEAVLILASGGGFTVQGQNGSGPPVCTGGAGATLTVDYGATPDVAGAPMRVSGPRDPCPTGGCRYRWGQLAVRGAGPCPQDAAHDCLNVSIEHLPMERYLRGLAEVPSSWPAAALQAQAIAGRSYAEYKVLHRRAPAADPGYDLFATTSDQAYSGYEKEAGASGDLWVAAVDATAHQVSTSSNEVIQAFYSSSSGGYTESSEYVFVATLPYTRGVADPYDADPSNPNAFWTRSYSGSELGSWVASRYGSIGSVLDMAISSPLGVSGRIDKANVRLSGTAGTLNLSGAQLRSMVNAYAGSGRTLLSTKVSLRPNTPFGSFDAIGRGPGGAWVGGWAIDPGTTGPIDVHVYVDGVGAAVLRADGNRPDVGAAYPAYGAGHGFSGIAPIASAGSHTVCAYAVGSASALIGCKGISITTNPFGSIDLASGASGGVQFSGWAIDPDTATPIEVHVYLDGNGAAVLNADNSRPDVGAAYPGYGNGHGYSASVAASEGSHVACAYGINVGAGSNVLLGCRTVDVRATPFGSVDSASRTTSGIRLSGWAIDPNTTSAIDIHVYVDGSGASAQTATGDRPDVGTVYPAYGPGHGFDLTVPASPGAHTVCVYAINVGPGGNQLIACRSV